MGAGYVNLRHKRKKAGEEGGMRKGRFQSGTSGLCLGITQHLCDKTHSLVVRQPSAAGSCKKMGSELHAETG